jgi:hypothetical protein
VVVAIASTWPLVTELSTSLPMGSEAVATVPLLNLWTVWWNSDRASAGFAEYWDAPIFYPTRTTFAFSEAQPTTLVVAPLIWLSGRPALGYNLYLLATLTLNGGMTYQLLRRTGLPWWPAVWGGGLVQMLPFVSWQLGVLQLTQLWPVIWMVWGLLRWSEHPRWRTAIEIGVAFGWTYAACNYYGLFAALLLTPSGLWLLRRRDFTWAAGGQFLISGLVAVGLIAPLITVQRRAAAEHQWEREEQQVIGLSAHLRDYTDTPFPQWLDCCEIPAAYRTNIWVLGMGWFKLVTAGIGAVCGLLASSRRRWTLVALTFGLVAVTLSLGPNAELWNLSLYRGLRKVVPGLSQIRSPFRFAVFVQLAVAWLCAEALFAMHPQHWWDRLGTRITSRWFRALMWLPMSLLGGVLLGETLPPKQPLRRLPEVSEWPRWVKFLRDETPAGSPLVCVPVPLGTSVNDFEREADWMIWGMAHRRPLLNGYSGYFPDSYVTLNQELDHFPDEGVPRLQAMGARYAVVDAKKFPAALLAKHPQTAVWQQLLSDNAAGMDVYQLPRTVTPPSTVPAPPAKASVPEPTGDREEM